MNNDILKFAVADLLPHDPPMVLLDRVLEYGSDHLVAEVQVGPHALFSDEEGNIPAWIGIEYMAQTVAALAGADAKKAGKPVSVGFLLGTRRYLPNVSYFTSGDRLKVTAKRTYENDGVGSFDCDISTDRLLVQARINAYQPEPDKLRDVLE